MLKEFPENGFKIDGSVLMKVPTLEARARIRVLESLATKVRLEKYIPETVATIALLREEEHKKTTELAEFLTTIDRNTLSALGLLSDKNKIEHNATDIFPEWAIQAVGPDKLPPRELEGMVIWLTTIAKQFKKLEPDKNQEDRFHCEALRNSFLSKLRNDPDELDRLQKALPYIPDKDRAILERYGYYDINGEPPILLEKEDEAAVEQLKKYGLYEAFFCIEAGDK